MKEKHAAKLTNTSGLCPEPRHKSIQKFFRYGRGPILKDLNDEFAHHSKTAFSEGTELCPAGKRVISLSWLLLSLFVDIKEKEVT